MIVPEKVPVPRCFDVPKVECFQVLAPVPDLECAPRAHEDCVDIVNEVILSFSSHELTVYSLRFLTWLRKKSAMTWQQKNVWM